MADISKVKILNGQEYEIKDAVARTGLAGKIDTTEKGATSGVAELDSSGKVPVSQLPAFAGATSSVAGTAGVVPASATTDTTKFLRGDGSWADAGKPMVILSYGNSTWDDFISAYNDKNIVYCRASSNSNPATGSQTRMAFMAYVNDATNPTNVEFQYYRSLSSHSITNQGDEVYVYTLKNTNAWSVTTRKAYCEIETGTYLTRSYTTDKVTLNVDLENKSASSGGTDVSLVTTGEKYTWNNKLDANQGSANSGKYMKVGNDGALAPASVRELPSVTSSDNGKFLTVVNGAWAATTMQAWQGGSY